MYMVYTITSCMGPTCKSSLKPLTEDKTLTEDKRQRAQQASRGAIRQQLRSDMRNENYVPYGTGSLHESCHICT